MGGREGGFYVKVIDLEPDLSKFRLFFSPITRVSATPKSLEDYVVANFDAVMPDDFSPFILGLIDAKTFVEQHIQASDVRAQQIYPYVIRTYEPDLVLSGVQQTDSVQHRFLAWGTPDNELYDAENGPIYWDYIEQSYQQSDRMLGTLWAAMPDANVFATADHGFSVSGKVVNANYLLETLTLYNPADLANSQAVAYTSGAGANVYINLEGRNPDGVVASDDYETLRQQIADAFNALGASVIEKIFLKEETGAIPTTLGVTWNYLHPDRTGDVLVFLKPPYQFSAPVAEEVLADISFMGGQHGYLPNGDPDRFAAFVAAGPRIVQGKVISPVTALDLAPTVADLLGIDPPAQSVGNVLDILVD
jgi:predicted AlkP superfamily phosphohydrolase/phosphomutase